MTNRTLSHILHTHVHTQEKIYFNTFPISQYLNQCNDLNRQQKQKKKMKGVNLTFADMFETALTTGDCKTHGYIFRLKSPTGRFDFIVAIRVLILVPCKRLKKILTRKPVSLKSTVDDYNIYINQLTRTTHV